MINPDDFDFIAKLVYDRSGLVLTPDKSYLLESRLVPVARKHGLKGLTELAGALRARSVQLIADTVEGRVRPVMSLFDCRTIGLYPTTVEPMATFVRKMKSLEGKDGVLSVSLGHGFPWADVREVGTKMLIVTDDRKEHGDKIGRAHV